MNDRPPSGLERLWRAGTASDREPRLGLSLERIIESAIELADSDGLGAVSMKRVAERLGFTTMSLYRYVASKDDLLLLMHDAAWQPPPGLDTPCEDWRSGLERWCREQHVIMQRHPWLEQIRITDRAGTPSQLTWMDLGLRTLADTPLTEHLKAEVLLLLSGYVFWEARFAGDIEHAARQGVFSADHAAEAYGELLNALVDAERFPALRRTVEAGIFDVSGGNPYAEFAFGVDLILDGIDCLMGRQTTDSASPRRGPGPAREG